MEQRWHVAQTLYATAREWKTSAIKSIHPDWLTADVRAAVRKSFCHAGR